MRTETHKVIRKCDECGMTAEWNGIESILLSFGREEKVNPIGFYYLSASLTKRVCYDACSQHVIQLADHKKLAETIVSTIEVVEGRDAKAVTSKFGAVVYDAVKHLPPSKTPRLALNAP